ncbi:MULTISPECIES: hypothetical protein [Thiomicrorhabdus]|uniref:Uncharacterized protein n=1 Tax=Thiomicrorhabdus heinhorstiae TaxID=2748010 RepID=A0ABS0BU77_9GAMM|nr:MULTISPECIES: hypothetical protein [Thiomicrorhabdus]MBF6057393.1 hypothetical protein [Thiomicrorhabdus heinhorstiae]
MSASPITSWEGATAYFTFADSPAIIGFILILSIVVTLGVIAYTFYHEAHSYIDYK